MARRARTTTRSKARTRARSKKMLIEMTGIDDLGRHTSKKKCMCGMSDVSDLGWNRKRSMMDVGDLGRSRSECFSPVYNSKTGVTMCRKRTHGGRLVFSHKQR